MHEGPFDKHEAEGPPIYVANNDEDGGMREDWMDAAEYIAHVESANAFSRRRQEQSIEPMRRQGHDELEPGFLMVGRRKSLEAIAESVTGIIEHGQAFVAWAHMVGDDPEGLRLFDEAFLGSWESAAQFASQIMGEPGPLSTDASGEDQQFRMLLLASELAEELLRRGVICAIPNNRGGIWVFRGSQGQQQREQSDSATGGEDA
jgi:hypothetical protein